MHNQIFLTCFFEKKAICKKKIFYIYNVLGLNPRKFVIHVGQKCLMFSILLP